MLRELKISNVALVDELHVEFGPGFNVLTGETGAGKSVIVGSLEFVLGGRADARSIRTGADRAIVDAAFEMEKRIIEIRDEGDSSGGLVEVVATGLPAGMGEPVFNKIDGELGRMMSIGTVKAVEIGAGYAVKDMRGSECNDAIRVDDDKNVYFKTNNAGGMTGGVPLPSPVNSESGQCAIHGSRTHRQFGCAGGPGGLRVPSIG